MLFGKAQTAEPADSARPQLGIEPDRAFLIPCLLSGPCFHHQAGKLPAALSLFFSLPRQAGKFHPGHLRTNIHPIQNRAGYPAQIPLYLSRGTAALVPIRIITAGAGIHCRHQHKVRRIAVGSAASGDLYPVFFHGLSQQIQCVPFKFGEFVQKQDPSVSQADHSRTGNPSAAGKGVGSDGMMRIYKRPFRNQPASLLQHTRHTVHLGYLQLLPGRKRRQYGGHTAGNHGFSRSGRPYHQQMMKPGRRHHCRSLGTFLSLDLPEIGAVPSFRRLIFFLLRRLFRGSFPSGL